MISRWLRSLYNFLVRWLFQPPCQPGLIKLEVSGEVMRKNITVITLPSLGTNPDEVATRVLTIESGTTTVFLGSYPIIDNADVPPITVNLAQGVPLTISLVDKDAAGNASIPRVVEYTPVDVTAPQQPTIFNMTVTGEIEED